MRTKWKRSQSPMDLGFGIIQSLPGIPHCRPGGEHQCGVCDRGESTGALLSSGHSGGLVHTHVFLSVP